MDLHIERPELNGQSTEENIAKVDTWIADTADKLNIALTSMQTGKLTGTGSSSSDGSLATKSELRRTQAKAIYLGDWKEEAREIILGG